MNKRWIKLYDEKDLLKAVSKRKSLTFLSVLLGVLTLAACILICVFAKPRNVTPYLIAAICVSTVGGWIVISIVHFPLAAAKAEVKHINAILEGERELIEGRFKLTDERTFIKNGVGMYSVKNEEDGSAVFKVFDKFADRMPSKELKTIQTVYGFVTAYEVNDADD